MIGPAYAALAVLVLGIVCNSWVASAVSQVAERGSPSRSVSFVDVAEAAGIVLRNQSGSAEKLAIVESTGAGACFLDYDLDSDLDLYIVNGASLETGVFQRQQHLSKPC